MSVKLLTLGDQTRKKSEISKHGHEMFEKHRNAEVELRASSQFSTTNPDFSNGQHTSKGDLMELEKSAGLKGTNDHIQRS